MARSLMGISLGFHIIFATLGVGLPLLISLSELLAILRKDNDYLILAKRWTQGFLFLVAVGAVSGTVVGVELSLLFPHFMALAGQVIVLPLFMEVFAFFIEAIFLAIYAYAWDRFSSPWLHWLVSIPVFIGAMLSAVFITDVNAFMNTPTGFVDHQGHLSHIHPLAAILNPAFPTEALHVVSSAYLTAAFVIVGLTAFFILKHGQTPYYRKALQLSVGLGTVMAITTALLGDASGKFLARHQPVKLAAAEVLYHTQSYAPLRVGGILNSQGHLFMAIKIPALLSFLAFINLSHPVKGLLAFPKSQWPPLFIHYFFDGMVGLGTYLVIVGLLYLILAYRRSPLASHRFLLIALLLGGPFALLALEFGWLLDEFGRQPWVITGLLTSTQGATTQPVLGLMILFISVYLFLTGTLIWSLLFYFKKHPLTMEKQQARDTGWEG